MTVLLNFIDPFSGAGLFGLLIGLMFFVLLAAAAYVAYRALARSVKFAVRLGIAAFILFIAVAGGLALWYFGASGSPGKERIRTEKPAKSRTK